MKRIYSIILVLMMAGVNLTYAGLWPSVKKPNSPDASLIAVELCIDVRGNLDAFANANVSTIVPVLKMEDGSFVEFRMFAMGANVGTIYYKENLKPGKYTLIGFEHVYVDWGKLHEYRIANGYDDDDIHIIPKKPYDDKPYRVRQSFDLDEPIEFTLEPNKMMTLGKYVLKYRKANGGLKGSTADRYKITRHEIMMVDSKDQSLLGYMKPWRSKDWKLWNAKNPAKLEK